MELIKNKIISLLLLLTFFGLIFYDFSLFYSKIFSFNNKKSLTIDLVVLTGGTNRIKQTLNLLTLYENKKFNLLISGAGKGFNKATVLKLSKKKKISKELVNCCINIDKKSTDTYSNALETLAWTKKNNIDLITLITSNYHMPRALTEFKNLLKNVKIVPYVLNDKTDDKKIDFDILIIEYLKFTIAKIRIITLNIL